MSGSIPLKNHWSGRYVGLPFGEDQGQVTCWSLIRLVYSDLLSVDLPEYGEISARDLVRVARAMKRGADDGWDVVRDPKEFDVVLMRSGSGGVSVVHVGVMVSESRMLHVEQATSSVIVPLRHISVVGRIVGYRRMSR